MPGKWKLDYIYITKDLSLLSPEESLLNGLSIYLEEDIIEYIS